MTKIEWTDETWNPLRGCSRVSEGCRNCYAETMAGRFCGPGQPYEGLVKRVGKEARWTGNVAMAPDHVLTQPLRWKRPRRIFVNSMSDLFHENVSDGDIDRIFAVMALTPQHSYQILTKRPERMRDYLLKVRHSGGLCESMGIVWELARDMALEYRWPVHYEPQLRVLPNVWLGVSVEDQATADARIPVLLDTPTALRFISAEPLLGPLYIAPWLPKFYDCDCAVDDGGPYDVYFCEHKPCPKNKMVHIDGGWDEHDKTTQWVKAVTLDLVISGGESGRNARPTHPDWHRSLRDQCAESDTAFFFKQWGEWAPAMHDEDDARVLRQIETVGKFDSWTARVFNHDQTSGINWRYLGKKRAGNLLDGKIHQALPAWKDSQ